MKVERFFEKFEELVECPGSVPRMRAIVLHLAVSGRLVGQDPREEPASFVLTRAAAERSDLEADRTIRRRDSRPVASDEQPFEIPRSWRWARLSDVGHELGQRVPSQRFTYIDVSSIDSALGRIKDSPGEVAPEDAPSRARKLVVPGTVIYSTVRPYLLNVAIVDRRFDPEPIASTAFGILHPFAKISERYLFYWLRSEPFTAYVQGRMKGMAYPAINDEHFYSGVIPLPPLAEQKRIVAKVDELMALCDRLETQQQERETRHAALASASRARFSEEPTLANLEFLFHKAYGIDPESLRRAVLEAAVRGGLATQVDDDEPVESTVNQARQEAGLPPACVSQRKPDRMPFAIPRTWRWLAVHEVAQARLGKMLDKAKGRGQPQPYLRNTNVHWFRFELASVKAMPFLAAELAEYALEPGDIMICEGGHGIARAAVWRGEVPGMKFQKALHRVRPLACLESDYFTYFLWVAEGSGWLQNYYTGAGIPHFTGRSLARLLIPLPPLSEQRRIVTKVRQLMTLIDQLEAQLGVSRTAGEKLLEAVVAELTQGACAS